LLWLALCFAVLINPDLFRHTLNINNSNASQRPSTIAPHIAGLGFRGVVVECLFGGLFRRDYFHPEIIAVSSNLEGYLEKAYHDLETSSVRDFEVNEWCSYRGILEAALMSYGHQELIEAVINALPDESPHGATGTCVALSSHLLRAFLPLPESFHCGPRTLCDKQKVKDWFIANRAYLKWDQALDGYILAL
jgi:hypothetical protein